MYTGINASDIKERNRGLLLRLLCCEGVDSRIEMAKRSGLSKMAVTNITAQLIQDGWLEETHLTETNRVGRNPMGLALSASSPRVLGLYLSRKQVTAVLADACCTILHRETAVLEEGETRETLLEKCLGVLCRVRRKSPQTPLLGIGVAAIGPLDCENGVLLNPRNFFGISQVPLKEALEKEWGLPVIFNNDMNAAALAEALFSPDRRREFLYLGISDGVGAGIISDGRLFQNNGGFVGEIGHLGVDENGPLCSCGNHGCLELYVSMPVILAQVAAALQVQEGTVAPEQLQQVLLLPACGSIFRQLEYHLSYALTSAVNLLNPEMVLLGHEGVFLPDSLLYNIEKQINRKILASGHREIKVQKSSFGREAPIVGSVCCVLDKVFAGNLYCVGQVGQ